VPQLCHIQRQKGPTVAHFCTEVHEIMTQKTLYCTVFSEIAPFRTKLPVRLKIVVSTVQFCPLAPEKTAFRTRFLHLSRLLILGL
jgi:hypothetical protein